jgi:hypothetical protein
MKKISLLMVLGCAMAFSAAAQTINYKERISVIHKNIYQTFYDKGANLYLETNNVEANKGNHSFLWPLTALLQAANEMEALEPGKQYIAPVMKAIQQYYSDRAPAPAYQAMVVKEKIDARFYDDNEWIAIALMDAYARTHKKQYLETSKDDIPFPAHGARPGCRRRFLLGRREFKSKEHLLQRSGGVGSPAPCTRPQKTRLILIPLSPFTTGQRRICYRQRVFIMITSGCLHSKLILHFILITRALCCNRALSCTTSPTKKNIWMMQ